MESYGTAWGSMTFHGMSPMRFVGFQRSSVEFFVRISVPTNDPTLAGVWGRNQPKRNNDGEKGFMIICCQCIVALGCFQDGFAHDLAPIYFA